MHDLKQIFICHKCGEVDGYYHEHIDTERDKIYPAWHCPKCNGEVEPKMNDGFPCYRQMSEDEMLAEQGFFSEPEESEEEFEF